MFKILKTIALRKHMSWGPVFITAKSFLEKLEAGQVYIQNMTT